MDQALAFAKRLAAMPPQAVQESKAVLNQILRANAVAVLGYGLAAESQSHDTPEYAAVPESFKNRENVIEGRATAFDSAAERSMGHLGVPRRRSVNLG